VISTCLVSRETGHVLFRDSTFPIRRLPGTESVSWLETLVSRGIWKEVSFGVPGEQMVPSHRSFLLKAHSEHFRKIMQAQSRILKILPFPI
jgi:hypothetical protein